MVIKKRGLGRGLDALLGQAPAAVAPPNQVVRELPIEQLRPGRYQPRREMDATALEELASSIRSQGVMQPITVRPLGETSYEIIAGERRWRASQLAGLHQVPVIVRDVPDEAAIAMSLIENIQRENLNCMEEARALLRLAEEFSLTHQEVADAVGKSRTAVTNSLRLNQLAPEVTVLIETGRLEMGHARTLLTLPPFEQKTLAHLIADKELSVRQAEALVRRRTRESDGAHAAPRVDKDVERLAQHLSETLGQPVSIRHSARGKGQVVINYQSLDELDGLLGRLGVKEDLDA